MRGVLNALRKRDDASIGYGTLLFTVRLRYTLEARAACACESIRVACTAFLPPSPGAAVCERVAHREMFLYTRAALAADVCFRSLGRRRATWWNVQLAVRLSHMEVSSQLAPVAPSKRNLPVLNPD